MKFTLFSLAGLLALAMAFAAVQAEAKTVLGLAWAANNQWAHKLSQNPNTKYYHHWEMRHVVELSRAGKQYVPMYWGPSKSQNWPTLKKLFARYRYPRALFLNEPDVSSRANQSPSSAVNLFMKEMVPLRQKYGTKVSSPNICYDVNWLSSFMSDLKKRGSHVDFIAVHYYGGWNSVGKLKSYINKIHSKYPSYKIWVTEFGVTSSSNPSASQAKNFFVQAVDFFGKTGYVDVVFPFGMWAKAPDSFGSQQNAAFNSGGGLRTLGQYWAHVNPAKRDLIDEAETPQPIMRRHHAMVKRIIAAEPTADEENWDITDEAQRKNAVSSDCDESNPRSNCKFLDSWLAKENDDAPEDTDAPADTDNAVQTPAARDSEFGDDLSEEELDQLEAQLV